MIDLTERLPGYQPGTRPGMGYDVELVVGADVHYDGVHDRVDAVHLHTIDRNAKTIDVPPGAIILVKSPANGMIAVYRAYGRTDMHGAPDMERLNVQFIGSERTRNSVAWRDWLAWVWRQYKPVTIPSLLPKGADT